MEAAFLDETGSSPFNQPTEIGEWYEPLIGGEREKGDAKGPRDKEERAPVRFSEAAVKTILDDLLRAPGRPEGQRTLLLQLKRDTDAIRRLEILRVLLDGRNIGQPDAVPRIENIDERNKLQELVRACQFPILRHTVERTYAQVRDYHVSGEVDAERRQFYDAARTEDMHRLRLDMDEFRKNDTNAERIKKLDAMILDLTPNRLAVLRQLRDDPNNDARTREALSAFVRRQENIELFDSLLNQNPDARLINRLGVWLRDDTERARVTSWLRLQTTQLDSAWETLLQAVPAGPARDNLASMQSLGNRTRRTESLEERTRRIESLQTRLDIEENSQVKSLIARVIAHERAVAIFTDLPREEQRRADMLETFRSALNGNPNGVLAMYTYTSSWLRRVVPVTIADMGYHRGLELPTGCPIPLPLLHGRPMGNNDLFLTWARQGRLRLDLTSNPEEVLESPVRMALLLRSVDWLGSATRTIDETAIRFSADNLVTTLRRQFGDAGIRRYGPQGIPERWLPPSNVSDLPQWEARINYINNLSMMLRNYTQAFKTLEGIANGADAIRELEALGVTIRFEDNVVSEFYIRELEAIDLRLHIPWLNRKVRAFEEWLHKWNPTYESAIRPIRDASARMELNKDPRAFLRHGDFAFHPRLHPDVGVKYDVIKHRINNIRQVGNSLQIDVSISYQTAGYLSYNYWFDCQSITKTMSPAQFRRLNPGRELDTNQTYTIMGDDGTTRENWRYTGNDTSGNHIFTRDERFTLQISLSDMVPVMTATGHRDVIPAAELNTWYLWQKYLYHHGAKVGKVVMDVGMTYTGGAGLLARGCALGKIMSLGRFAVGIAGLGHHLIDKLDEPTRRTIHQWSHYFILFDISTGLLHNTFFGAAKTMESASLINRMQRVAHADARAHAAMATVGLAIYGPIVKSELEMTIAQATGTSRIDRLNQAASDVNRGDLVLPDVPQQPLRYDLGDIRVRTSSIQMLTRLKQNLESAAPVAVRARLQSLLDDTETLLNIDRTREEARYQRLRQAMEQRLARLFTPSDAAVLLARLERSDARPQAAHQAAAAIVRDQVARENAANPIRTEEKLLASAIATCLFAGPDGRLPDIMFQRTATIPKREFAFNGGVAGRGGAGTGLTVPEFTQELTVRTTAVLEMIRNLAENENESLAIRMCTAKMLWRLGQLDDYGLAGVLLEVVEKSTDRQLRASALICEDDVCLALLINDIQHQQLSSHGFTSRRLTRDYPYGLTANDLRTALMALAARDGTRPGQRVDDDIRCLIVRTISAGEQGRAVDRRNAIVALALGWEHCAATEGEYARRSQALLHQQMTQSVPAGITNRPCRDYTPDDIRAEKLAATLALMHLGSVTINGNPVTIEQSRFHNCLIACLSQTDSVISAKALNSLNLATLTSAQRASLLAVLDWPVTAQSTPSKRWVLEHMREILNVGSPTAVNEPTIALYRQKILSMLNGANIAPETRGDSDNYWVGDHPALHAAALRSLVAFGNQHVETVEAAVTVVEFCRQNRNLINNWFPGIDAAGIARLTASQILAKIRQGDDCHWQTARGVRQGGWTFIERTRRAGDLDDRLVLARFGDPVVSVLQKHLRTYDFPSAEVRLAALETAIALRIPNLGVLATERSGLERDVRVSTLLREARQSERQPLPPDSRESRDRVTSAAAAIALNREMLSMRDGDDEVSKWFRGQRDFAILFQRGEDGWATIRRTRMDAVYGYIGGNAVKLWDWWNGGNAAIDAKYNAVDATLEKRYWAALDRLYQIAADQRHEDSAKATQALIWIVVRNAAAHPEYFQEALKITAISYLCRLAREGGPHRGSIVRWGITRLLLLQPELDADCRMALLNAAAALTRPAEGARPPGRGESPPPLMSKVDLAALVLATMRTECELSGRTRENTEARRKLEERLICCINILAAHCQSPECVEYLEAISGNNTGILTHESPAVRAHARVGIRWLRDGVLRYVWQANQAPDRVSTVQQRYNAILTNLEGNSTEDACAAIARACAGYRWNVNTMDDELLRTALRRAVDDPRTRVRLIACSVLYTTPQIVNRTWITSDYYLAVERLYQIAHQPFRLSTDHPSIPYYKEEALDILNAQDSLSLPPERRRELSALKQRAINMAQAKLEGYLGNKAYSHPDPSMTRVRVENELARELTRANIDEQAICRLLGIAQAQYSTDQYSDRLSGLYRRALEANSMRARLGGAYGLVMFPREPNDVLVGVRTLQAILRAETRSAEHAHDLLRPTARTKEEARILLDAVCARALRQGNLILARQILQVSRAQPETQAQELLNLLIRQPASQDLIARRFLESSDGSPIRNGDPRLAPLRIACSRFTGDSDWIRAQREGLRLTRNITAAQAQAITEAQNSVAAFAAASVLVNSTVETDTRKALNTIAQIANMPVDSLLRQNARDLLQDLHHRYTSSGETNRLQQLNEANISARLKYHGLMGAQRICEPINDGPLDERAEALSTALAAADRHTSLINMDDACRAVFTYARPNGRFQPDSPIRRLLQSAAVLNGDERVRIVCACILIDHGATFNDDIKLGITVLANLALRSGNQEIRREAEAALTRHREGWERVRNTRSAPAAERNLAREALRQIESTRHKDGAPGKEPTRKRSTR